VRAFGTVTQMAGRAGNVLAAVVLGSVLAACGGGWLLLDRIFSPADGDSLAEDYAEKGAEQLNERLGHRNRVRDAEHVAATEVTVDPRTGPKPDSVQVAALAWSGRVHGDEKATVDVRFTVAVDAGGFGIGNTNTDGSATRCYRYTLQLYRYTTYDDIRCPEVTVLPVPSAAPVPRLPGDADKRLTAALRTATPATLAGAVRAAFPQEAVSVDTATAGGTLVAAVGVPAERDCVVMIRTADKKIKHVGFDRVQLEPGETGCTTALYTHPAR
jgi:hypothetical protein